jgi:hypothetical protein
MVATTNDVLFTQFARYVRSQPGRGNGSEVRVPPYITAVVVWRDWRNDYSSKAVLLLSQLWATVKHVARWEPYSTETSFTGTFLCSTESKGKTNVVHYTGSLILSDNYLLPLPVGSFIALTSPLKSHTLVREEMGCKKRWLSGLLKTVFYM